MKFRNPHLLLVMAAVAALILGALLPNAQIPSTVKDVDDEGLRSRFDFLSNAKTNLCSLPDFIHSKPDHERLQGSCCQPMDFHRYTEQIEGLRKFSRIDMIPSDPYDIQVSLAKELLRYQVDIQLRSEQQATYDEATKLSSEGGPCCCVCWRWYAFEGLANYLITQYGFNAERIAEVWDLADGCGGPGHVHT